MLNHQNGDAAPMERVTRTGRPLGPLLKLKQVAAITGFCGVTLRNWRRAGKGPPLFTRPDSDVLVGYEGEILDWLESNRQPQRAA
jgi:hypothetical protein